MDPVGSRFVIFKKKSGGNIGIWVDVGYDLQYGFAQNSSGENKNKTTDISYNWNVHFDTDMGGSASLFLPLPAMIFFLLH